MLTNTDNQAGAALAEKLEEAAALIEAGWFRRDGRQTHIKPPSAEDCDRLRLQVEAFIDAAQRNTIHFEGMRPTTLGRAA